MINSQRFKKTTFLLKFKKIIKHFNILLQNSAGRNNQGSITVFSKGLKKRIRTIIPSQMGWDNRYYVNVGIIRNKKKLLNLNKHICGSFSLQPYISGVDVGQRLFSSNLPQKY